MGRKSVSRYIGRRNVKANNRPRLPKVLGLPTPGPSGVAVLRRVRGDLESGQVLLYFSSDVTDVGGLNGNVSRSPPSWANSDGVCSIIGNGVKVDAGGAAPFPVVDAAVAWNGDGGSPTFVDPSTLAAFYVGVGQLLPIADAVGDPVVVTLRYTCFLDMSNVISPLYFSWNDGGDFKVPSFVGRDGPYTLLLSGWVDGPDTGIPVDHLSYRFGLGDNDPVLTDEVRTLRGLVGMVFETIEVATP